jgi:hypothetical protein
VYANPIGPEPHHVVLDGLLGGQQHIADLGAVMPALIELNLILPGAHVDRLMHGHVSTFFD